MYTMILEPFALRPLSAKGSVPPSPDGFAEECVYARIQKPTGYQNKNSYSMTQPRMRDFSDTNFSKNQQGLNQSYKFSYSNNSMNYLGSQNYSTCSVSRGSLVDYSSEALSAAGSRSDLSGHPCPTERHPKPSAKITRHSSYTAGCSNGRQDLQFKLPRRGTFLQGSDKRQRDFPDQISHPSSAGTTGGAMGTASSIFLAAEGKENLGKSDSFERSDPDLEPVYEDIPDFNLPRNLPAPPKLAPYSGCFTKSPEKSVIRPIAFKPVTQTQSLPPPTPPQGILDSKVMTAPDEGYASHDTSRSCSHNPYALPYTNGVGLKRDGKLHKLDPGNCDKNQSHSAFNLTPSPSNSYTSDEHYEKLLREKEAEIVHLRHVLEHNEKVIFAVCEDRQREWQQQMAELAEEYQRRLHGHEDRVQRLDAGLRLQLSRAQAENEHLSLQLAKQEDECRYLHKVELQLQQYKARCEEVESRLSSKQGEAMSLSKQVENLKNEVALKKSEIKSLAEQLSAVQDKLESNEQQMDELNKNYKANKDTLTSVKADLKRAQLDSSPNSIIIEKSLSSNHTSVNESNNVRKLEEEMDQLRSQLNSMSIKRVEEKGEFDRERKVWQDEKTKVLQYQHQLQLNYVQMYRRNSELESHLGIGKPSALVAPHTHVKVRMDETVTESLC